MRAMASMSACDASHHSIACRLGMAHASVLRAPPARLPRRAVTTPCAFPNARGETSSNNCLIDQMTTSAVGAFLCLSIACGGASAASPDTVKVFENSCAGCHSGGGNIIKRDATLELSDLKKYGLDSPDALYDIIYGGKGSMPGFGEGCTPKGKCTFAKRLGDDEVRNLAAYILEQPW